MIPSLLLTVILAVNASEPTASKLPEIVSTLNELDDELTRVELELIRKELKQLSDEKMLSPVVQAKIDLLRNRLKVVREKLDREGASESRVPPTPTTKARFPRN